MTLTSKVTLALLIAVMASVLAYVSMGTDHSVREFLGLTASAKKTEATAVLPSETARMSADSKSYPGIDTGLDFNQIQKVFAVLDEGQRKALLADGKAFTAFVRNEAANKSVLAAAKANKIDENQRNQYIINRGVENIIREIYLKQLIASKVPKDFPAEEQMRAYFDKNKDKFIVDERVHVWQIFLPFKDVNDQKERELTKKQAEAIINDLNKNTLDFAAAAEKYSKLPAGKYNGGYMGLVKVSELKPEIRQPLMGLAPDKISTPLQTTDGIHILKRGAMVQAQKLTYEEVKDQIKRLLAAQLQNQLKQAIFKQAGESYPVDITEKNVEEWRLKLRTSGATDKTTKE